MKRTLTLAVVALLSAVFTTSCTKTYTCTCTVDGDVTTSEITSRKPEAKLVCESMEQTYQSNGSPDASCSL